MSNIDKLKMKKGEIMVRRIGKRIGVQLILALIITFICFQSAFAVTVTGYDVVNAEPSGFGLWSHYYNGTMTNNGGLVNYAGGSGSMNNGVIENSIQGAQLFSVYDNPVITVYLDGTYNVSTIELFGGDIAYNWIPGILTGWTVGIGSTSQYYSSTAFGNTNDYVTLNAGQQAIATNQFTLSGFTTEQSNLWKNYFSIAEIRDDARTAGTEQHPSPNPPPCFFSAVVCLALSDSGGSLENKLHQSLKGKNKKRLNIKGRRQ